MARRATAEDSQGLALDLPNETDAVESARLALLEYLGRFGLEQKIINRIEVVAEELISNVVRHSASATRVNIEAGCDGTTIRFAICDDGEAYNPLDRPDPAPFTTLEDAKLGGLGIPLIRRLTESVSYVRIDGHNRIDLTFAAK